MKKLHKFQDFGKVNESVTIGDAKVFISDLFNDVDGEITKEKIKDTWLNDDTYGESFDDDVFNKSWDELLTDGIIKTTDARTWEWVGKKITKSVNERWDTDVEIKSTGKYADKTVEELESELSDVKAKSKKHQDDGEDVPRTIIRKEHQLNFAIRAKKGWPKGISESVDNPNDFKQYKKGQFIKVDIDGIRKQQHDFFLIRYKSLPKKIRENEYYTKYFNKIKEDDEAFILKLKNENPKITKVVDYRDVNVIFSNGTESVIGIEFILDHYVKENKKGRSKGINESIDIRTKTDVDDVLIHIKKCNGEEGKKDLVKIQNIWEQVDKSSKIRNRILKAVEDKLEEIGLD